MAFNPVPFVHHNWQSVRAADAQLVNVTGDVSERLSGWWSGM